MSTSSSGEAADPAAGAWAAPWFTGRRVVVTGGTSGIGNGIARAFASAGASVLATGATATEVAKATHAPPEAGPAIDYRQLDVRDADAVAALFGEESELAALVNCAGVIRRIEEHAPEVFADVVDINLNGMMRCATAAKPALLRAGGAVVNLASMLSFFGGGLVPAYAASKGGVAQLTKSLAIAWAPEGIRVNALAPGWIATPLTSALQENDERSSAILSRTPMARWGEPGDIAGPALFLCTPLAGFITGAILPVDGGYAVC